MLGKIKPRLIRVMITGVVWRAHVEFLRIALESLKRSNAYACSRRDRRVA